MSLIRSVIACYTATVYKGPSRVATCSTECDRQEVFGRDATQLNLMTRTTTNPAALELIRNGLAQLRPEVLEDADDIRRQRNVIGLENR